MYYVINFVRCEIHATFLLLLKENVVIRKVELSLEGEDLEKAVSPVIREYFEHGDSEEVMVSTAIECSF